MATTISSASGSTSGTTSTASSSTSTANATAAANRTAAQKLLTSLSAGSGVDVASLAQNLVDAERIPQENAINAKITKNESRISGYAAMSYVMSQVQTALTDLKDQKSFNSLSVDNSAPSAFSVTTTTSAAMGAHDIEVLSLAKGQRSVSGGFSSATASLNRGGAFDFAFTVGGNTQTVNIAAGSDTPQGIVDAINAANTGVKAQVVNTGDAVNPYKIALIGEMGSAKQFSFTEGTTSFASLGLTFTNVQAASDAQVKVDGVSYTRTSNSLSDVVPGLTLNLKATTSAATINLSRDTAGLQAKMQALVTAYNDAQTIFTAVSDPKSTLDTYGATLVGDSTVRTVRQQLRDMLMSQSSTPGSSVGALWQMGISIDRTGVMSLDSTKLDTALNNNFDDVVKTMTGNQNGLTALSSQSGGVAGDAVKKLTTLLGPTGAIASQTTNAGQQNAKYKADLTKLQTRMDSLLTRYQKQFAAMDSLVGSVNAQKTSLKSSFDGMMAMYTNK